jgi:TrmH family RNA methyltransferase
MEKITSTKNPLIKDIIKLEKPKIRREEQLFIIEGFREISRAYEAGYIFDRVLFCPDLKSFIYHYFIEKISAEKLVQVSSNVFSRIAYRGNTDGLVVLAKMNSHEISSIKAEKDGLYLVLESVEKPGNLGAILRTRDVVGGNAVFICDNQTDLYNPNTVRSSLGCIFTNQIVTASSEETVSFLKKNDIKIYSAALQDSVLYFDTDFSGPSAIVLGAEADGLSKIWRENADRIIAIPMSGIADSLNVSVTAAILVFEAIRQRHS